jgi:hypothetical protein
MAGAVTAGLLAAMAAVLMALARVYIARQGWSPPQMPSVAGCRPSPTKPQHWPETVRDGPRA